MKIKLLITLISGALMVLFLIIDLQSVNNSTTDRWVSFGLGLTAPIFVSSIIAAVVSYRKQKAV